MKKWEFQGVLTEKEEFLFPDMEYSVLPPKCRITMAKNGRPGVQLLIKTRGKKVLCRLESEELSAEWFQMKAIPVEYNTGDGEEQGGAMVVLKEEKPDYAIRKAPFWVYDCLRPVEDGVIEAEEGQCALYFCILSKENVTPGQHKAILKVEAEEGCYICEMTVQIYDVEIPQESFGVTNWFLLDAISSLHNVEQGSKEFYDMLDQYILQMRRVRQNMFYLELDQTCVKSREPYAFDFEYLYPIISRFFQSGMKTLEIGPLLSRGFLENGDPDMFTADFKCAMAPDISLETQKGYEITVAFVKTLAEFLKKNGWDDKVVFHIHDEPDVHYKDQESLEHRRRQYYMAGGILKKYLPQVKIIEAVKTTEFRGGIDIWVPVTSSYEEEKVAFDRMAAMGEEVWNYVCCVPEGKWLNRFLDDPVIHSRLMFWGFEKNRLSGYLHWGFNQFLRGMDPFKGTSCPNHTGLGTNFPCGDAFIVYPGTEGPWISMRLEAERRGTEDLELLKVLRQKNPELHRQLIERVYTNNYTYNDSPEVMNEVYEQLLEALETLY